MGGNERSRLGAGKRCHRMKRLFGWAFFLLLLRNGKNGGGRNSIDSANFQEWRYLSLKGVRFFPPED